MIGLAEVACRFFNELGDILYASVGKGNVKPYNVSLSGEESRTDWLVSGDYYLNANGSLVWQLSITSIAAVPFLIKRAKIRAKTLMRNFEYRCHEVGNVFNKNGGKSISHLFSFGRWGELALVRVLLGESPVFGLTIGEVDGSELVAAVADFVSSASLFYKRIQFSEAVQEEFASSVGCN